MLLTEFFRRKLQTSIIISTLLTALALGAMLVLYHFQYVNSLKVRIDDIFESYSEKISSQILLSSYYNLELDSFLIEPFEEVLPGTRAAIRDSKSSCLLSNCSLFNENPSWRKLIVEKTLTIADENVGTMRIIIPVQLIDWRTVLPPVITLLFAVSAMFLVNWALIGKSIISQIQVPIFSLVEGFKRFAGGAKQEQSLIQDLPHAAISEIRSMLEEFEKMKSKIHALSEVERMTHAQSARFAIASQVAHDIQSPLAALTLAESDLGKLPEETRLLIRTAVGRIRDISNHLRENSRKNRSNETAEPQLLSTWVNEMISEKRLEYKALKSVEINGVIDPDSYGLFAQVSAAEFKRVLSNIINNGVESLQQNIKVDSGGQGQLPGYVVVRLKKGKLGTIQVIIQDNGCGIPKELLPRLGERGLTFNKESGTGLGLFHARVCCESWSGKIHIDSEVGKGTQVVLELPEAQPPRWFNMKLEVPSNSIVVVLDDDESIHQIWQKRFQSNAIESQISLVHFSNPEGLKEWHRKIGNLEDQILFLVDFELIGSPETGLDVIESLGIQKKSILVTSAYDKPVVKERCQTLGVRLIPKNLAGFIPMKVISSVSQGRPQ